MKKIKTVTLRLIVIGAVLVVIAVGYFTTVGIGNISAIGFSDITLICPLGALLAIIAQKALIPQAVISLVLFVVSAIILGKFFCSWICPVSFLSKWFPGLNKKRKKELAISAVSAADGVSNGGVSNGGDADNGSGNIAAFSETDEAALTSTKEASRANACSACSKPCGKNKGMKLDSRHAILTGAVLSTLLFGFPVFCLVCPIGLTFASVLLVMRLFAFGDMTWAILVFPAIILIEIMVFPKWCQKICPLGALTSIVSGLNKTFRPKVDETKCLRNTQGSDCNLCHTICVEGIDLHEQALGETTINDCSKCRDCADVCPTGAISFPFYVRPKKPKDIPKAQTTIE